METQTQRTDLWAWEVGYGGRKEMMRQMERVA